MSNSSVNELSLTIANMIEQLNPVRSRRKTELRTTLDFASPSKRRLSSESLELPVEKRLKVESSLDGSGSSTWLSSPRETRRMRAEIVDLRATVASLENRIRHSHNIRKELQVMFDNEVRTHELQHVNNRKTIEALEEQVQSIRKREVETIEELETLKAALETSKLDYESKIEKMEIDMLKLKSNKKAEECSDDNEATKLRNRLEELEIIAEAAKQDAQAQKELSKELEVRLSQLSGVERDNQMKEQALLKAQMKVKDLEYTLESYGEWQAQAKIHHQRLLSYPDLEKEVYRLREETRNLRDEVKNKLLLEEQVHNFEVRMEKYREQDKTYSQLQASHSRLENLVEEWRLLVKGVCDENVPDVLIPKNVRQCIEKLQQQELTLTTEKVELESQLKQSQHDYKMAKIEAEKSTKQVTDLQNIQQQHKLLVHRLQKKLLLVSRERDSYRQQLDTYEKDLTVSIPSGTGVQNSQITAYKERIDSLETNIQSYREMVANLENEIRKLQPQIHEDNIAPIRSEQLLRLQEEVSKLQAEKQRLSERNDELEIRLEEMLVGKDKISGQVIHLKANPLAESVAERVSLIEKLHADIERYKRKIKNMEEGLENSKLSESVCTSREVQTLRDQLKSANIKNDRLKGLFKSSWNDLRAVLYMLFGYQINKQSDTQYQLSSMYAEAPDDFLQFQMDAEGNMNLLETPYSTTLEDLVELHLRHQKSIPVFLSALTIDLFNRTTMSS